MTSSSSSSEDEYRTKTKRRKTTSFVPVFKQDLSASESSDDEDDHHSVIEDEEVLPTLKEDAEAFNAARAQTGVVYLSKVPPFMAPAKVKHLLSQYGELGRIFLAPEPAKVLAKRVKLKGDKRTRFTEGWIEFTDKRKARLVAETLNAQKIGGKKSSFYHDDLWNLKYLPKFKWDDLTAQIAVENASRQSRMDAEIEQGNRETRHYLKNVERAKMIEGMQAIKRAKGEEPQNSTKRDFNQRGPKDKTRSVITAETKLNKVLGSIF